MNVSGLLITFFLMLLAGHYVVKIGWEIRYLAPLSFCIFFILTIFVFAILFPKDWGNVHFFIEGIFNPNPLAIDFTMTSCCIVGLITFLLVLGLWSIRKNIFF